MNKQATPVNLEELRKVSDADWQRQTLTRIAGIASIKTKTDYLLFRAVYDVSDARHKDDEPKTPDPHDRNVSKRSWEKSVQQWKVGLNLAVDLLVSQ
jgi:hypothetical protein